MEKLFVTRMSQEAVLPKRASTGAAGFDLFAAHQKIVPAKSRARVWTDVMVCYWKSHHFNTFLF